MPFPFAGGAVPLVLPDDIDAAAASLGVPSAAVSAVCTVECGGPSGFLSDGSNRPRILFEAKRFGDATGHRYDASHPLISSRVTNWKLYRGGAAEYVRLDEALTLDRAAALEATSWGMFQIMGSNASSLGFGSIDEFVDVMEAGERGQLEAFGQFLRVNHLVAPLKALDWPTFARGYNGPAWQANRYGERLATAYAMACGRSVAFLRIGKNGPAVATLQGQLIKGGAALSVDGFFGRATELAVMRFQSLHGLNVDGVAGPSTLAALPRAGVSHGG